MKEFNKCTRMLEGITKRTGLQFGWYSKITHHRPSPELIIIIITAKHSLLFPMNIHELADSATAS